MSHDRSADLDFDRATREWMLDGPTTMPDAAIDEAVIRALRTPQHGAPNAPRRYLTMTAKTIERHTRPGLVPLAAAAVLLLAVALGGYALLGRGFGVGDPAPAPAVDHDAEDAAAAADAPSVLADELVVAEPPTSWGFVIDGSHFEALHLVLRTAPITTSGDADDEARREALLARMYAGLEAAETRFYDGIGPSGDPAPVTEAGGSSFMVTTATYTDAQAASDAFAAFIESYETWGFDGTEPWDHGEESVAFGTTDMEIAHGRCFVLSSPEGCTQALRAWRTGNMVVSVLAEGEAGALTDRVVSAIDQAAR